MADLPDIPGYRLLKVLKQSKRSRTFLAEQQSLARQVALKVMSEEFFNEPILRQRFVDEGKSAARLNHPNVLAVFDIGSAGGYPFIATEFVPGGTLRDTLQQPMAPVDALRIAKELASALEYAHSQGVVHRDIKPSNILFRADGTAVLSDLGILKAQSVNASMQMGSPHYMSPEQIEGQVGDGRADLYSLGVVVFEMLTGRPPFDADDPFVVVGKHLSDPVPRLPSTLSVYQPLIDRTLAKKPEDRFASAREMVVAVDGFLEPKTTRDARQPQVQKPSAPAEKRTAPVAAKPATPMPDLGPRTGEQARPSGPPTMQQPVITDPIPAAQRLPAARHTGSGKAVPKNNPRRAMLRVLFVVAILVLLVWGAYWVLKGGGDMKEPTAPPVRQQLTATQGTIEADFAKADRLVAEGKWWPPGDNAVELYRDLQTRADAIGAVRAKAGLEKLGRAVAEKVIAKGKAGDPIGAQAVLAQARTFLPEDTTLAALQKPAGTP